MCAHSLRVDSLRGTGAESHLALACALHLKYVDGAGVASGTTRRAISRWRGSHRGKSGSERRGGTTLPGARLCSLAAVLPGQGRSLPRSITSLRRVHLQGGIDENAESRILVASEERPPFGSHALRKGRPSAVCTFVLCSSYSCSIRRGYLSEGMSAAAS